MRTFNFYQLFVLLLVAIPFTSCVQDDEFETPDTTVVAPDIQGNIIDINAVYNALIQEQTNNENATLTFTDTNNFITGFVISSDEAGNYFEELILQDAAENPTRGIRVLVDVNPLFTAFEFGRKVFIKLDGLTVGIENGLLSLGVRDGNSLEKIPESQLEDFIIRDVAVATIVPKVIEFSDFNFDNLNLYIQLNDVQFNRNDAVGEDRKTFAGEPGDQFDGERTLESCSSGGTVIFSTSTFADYKSVLLPDGRGTLVGILTLNFFGDEFNVTVNDPSTINFDSQERCDPIEVDCGIASSAGNTVLFSDFFETQQLNSPISGNGWTNFIEAGTETWEAYFDDGTNASLGISARMGSFGSGDASSIGWLVTPQIDFDANTGETFQFKSSNSFSDGSNLEILISLDWDGVAANIPNATWNLLPAAFVVQDSDFFGDFFPSGLVDLSCIDGQGYIAFKYIGSGAAPFDGTYEIDEIQIKAN